MTSDSLIARFHLRPLPIEGGMFHRYYSADEIVPHASLPARYTHDKLFCGAISYLHTPATRSLLHRLKTDEIYHFYNGAPVALILLYQDGSHRAVTLGQDYEAGQFPFFVAQSGVWQGSCLLEGGDWALMGTT